MAKEMEARECFPNYKIPCLACGRKPTIDSKTKAGQIEHLEMCGACTWGEADALDPGNW